MAQLSTRDRLLNAAEELIGRKGYSNTSLRDITGRANANLAAVHYHFGSKEGLAEAVLKRHLVPLNHERLALLEAELREADAHGRPPDTKVLTGILMGSILRHVQKGGRGKHFVRIFSRLHTDPDATLRALFLNAVQDILDAFFTAFRTALPQLPPEVLFTRLAFAFGAMGHAAKLVTDRDLVDHAERIGLPPLPDPETIVEELICFVTQGINIPWKQTSAMTDQPAAASHNT